MTLERRPSYRAEERDVLEGLEILGLLTEGLSFDEIARRRRTSKRTLYRRVRVLGSPGLSFTPDYTKLYEGARDPELEDQVTQLYKLRGTRILDLPTNFSCPEVYKRNEDSILHELLATEAAKHLADILKSGACLAVGGGRATFQAAIHLGRLHPSQEKVRVLPLYTGLPSTLTSIGRIVASPDSVAFRISTAFRKEGLPCATAKLARPLFRSDRTVGPGQDVEDAVWPWERELPDVALFGIGNVSNAYHHILIDPRLECLMDIPPVLRELRDLITIIEGRVRVKAAEHVPERYFSPVMEIVHRPMVVELDSSTTPLVSANEYKELANLCSRVNDYLLGISIGDLRPIPRKIGVAGGLYKYFAIRQAIENGLITDLITDREVAHLLISKTKSGQ